MDADSSLAAIALGLSLALYAVLCVTEGQLPLGLQLALSRDEVMQSRALSLLRDDGARAMARVGLIGLAVASGVALMVTLDPHWWVVALGTLGLVVLLVLVHGVAAGVGAHLGAKARFLLPLLWALALLAAPLSWLQGSASSAFSRRASSAPEAPQASLSMGDGPQGDFPVAQGEEGLAPHERRMITSILKLDETTAREIMVPRMDIVAAEPTSSFDRIAELMWDSGHSRIPIYEETIDSIIGVVHSRDLLRHLSAEEPEVDLSDIARPPLFIPDSKRLDELLRDFQENHIQIAIVVDEYGGTAGLVTIEDLLEEIVGEIEDEFDVTETLREMVSEHEAVVDARISLEEVNRVFAVNLQGEGFDTLGGLLYQQLGKIPGPGDEVEVDGLKIKVLTTLGRRIKKVQVARTAASESR